MTKQNLNTEPSNSTKSVLGDVFLFLESEIVNDEYTNFIYNSYDIQNKEKTTHKINIKNLKEISKENFNIGVVLGASGTGKTTILKNCFNKEIDNCVFDNSKSLISNFNFLEANEACLLLSSMGLSSVPTWLRPFNLLSNGEQYRAKLAYIVGNAKDNETILIDEYTSVVDRDVAKAMSNALQKYIRRTNKKIVLASCHFDIIEWLMPDFVFTPSDGKLQKKKFGQNLKYSWKYTEQEMKLGKISKIIII
jgi:ABC-type ATPase with predicted acetyltransferase domain